MREISLIIPFYRNTKMLREHHIPQWDEYPDIVLENLSIIIVDDCSPEQAHPIIEEFSSERVKSRINIFRILDDIPWNQHGARNLGAHVAKEGWLLFNDMDRIVLTHDMQQMMRRPLDPRKHYKPYSIRMGPRLKSDKNLPVNQFLVTKEVFWKAGGYDEDFCGTYGGDTPLLEAIARIAPLEIMPDVRLIRYHTGLLDLDATTTDLDRNHKLSPYKRFSHKLRGCKSPNNHLRFKWHRMPL